MYSHATEAHNIVVSLPPCKPTLVLVKWPHWPRSYIFNLETNVIRREGSHSIFPP